MPHSIVWVHGTSVSTSTNSDVTYDQRNANGAAVSASPGKDCWLHASIPVEIPTSSSLAVTEVYVRFRLTMGTMREVRVYDGGTRVHTFERLVQDGNYRGKLTPANTFTLPEPHHLRSGLGVSVRFNASHNMGSGPDPLFEVTAVGARVSGPPFPQSITAIISRGVTAVSGLVAIMRRAVTLKRPSRAPWR